MLNIEDTHTVNYALRKLLKSDLLEADKRGKEVFYRTSAAGAELIEAYRAVRNTCLIDNLNRTDMKGDDLRDIAAHLRAISGQYDQASRAAASL
jgi:predicted MarR family transcription regulator